MARGGREGWEKERGRGGWEKEVREGGVGKRETGDLNHDEFRQSSGIV